MDITGIIAGLGNPGPRYAGTRHNCGFMVLDELLKIAGRSGEVEELNGKRFNGALWRIRMPELSGKWLAVEAHTFMNDSGNCVQPLMAWYRLSPEQLLVIHDELDIPAGDIRFKFGGGLAGHNGLASISRALGSNNYYRLRVGIGKPTHKEDMISWVLGRPGREEGDLIEKTIVESVEIIKIFSRDGEKAAAQYARDASRLNRQSEEIGLPR